MEEISIAHKLAYVSAPAEYEFPGVIPRRLKRHKTIFVDLVVYRIKWKVTWERRIIRDNVTTQFLHDGLGCDMKEK